jgi:indolepyruvate ferredoxin oxidoreductase alpha subunit
MGLEEKISVLKIGTPYPLPEKMTQQFLTSVPEVVVVEELEPFVEDGVKAYGRTDDGFGVGAAAHRLRRHLVGARDLGEEKSGDQDQPKAMISCQRSLPMGGGRGRA